jgi:hypothetical protein
VKRLFIATLAITPLLLASIAATAQGRDATGATQAAPSKITICHKTGSASNPWRKVTVSSRAMTNPSSKSGKLLRGHMRHTGDAIIAGAAACPSAAATPAPTNTPASRITICHKTGSTANPYRRITVSSRAVTNPNSPAGKTLRGHMRHSGDLLLPGANACPGGTNNAGIRMTANLQPVQGATGSGTASFRANMGAGTLCYTLTVTGLTNVTAAHIHRVSTTAIVVPLTNAPTTGTSTGCETVARDLLREIVNNPGGFYVNVHTMTFPNGQVQGTLSR